MIALALLALALSAPAASADGFREPEVQKALRAAGFGTIAERAAAVSSPVLMLDRDLLPREPRVRGTTRFGGRPDLPAGTPWPRCRGLRQAFLGQIRVRDLPAEAAELGRLGGTLLFFTVAGSADDEQRYDVWPGRCSAVVHAPPGARLVRTSPPRGLLRLRPARMRFSLRPDLPDVTLFGDRLQAPLRDIRITDAEAERWFKLRETLNDDPRFEHQLLGYSRLSFNEDRCAARADRVRAPWRHLLTVGYDHDLGFDLPGAVRVQILISPADLRAGRFDRICTAVDSG